MNFVRLRSLITEIDENLFPVAGRNTRAVRQQRDTGGNGDSCQEYPLFRQPAVALSEFTHDRIHRGDRKR